MFEKQFGKTKLRTLEYKLELYKQKLKPFCAQLKYQKIIYQWKVINRQFANNPRQVFRQMKGIVLKVEVLPSMTLNSFGVTFGAVKVISTTMLIG